MLMVAVTGFWGLESAAESASLPTAKEVISAHKVCFDKPARHIPATTSVDAPLLGNGYMAVALGGTPDKQVFYLARNDFWRLKSAYNESYPAVLGKLQLHIPAMENASYRVEQDLYQAKTTVTIEKSGSVITNEMWVSAEEDFLICKLMSNTAMTFTADLHLPSKAEKVFDPRQDVVAVVDQLNIRYQNGIQRISRGFTKDVDIPATATAALRILSDAKAQPFTLSPDKPVYLALALSSNFKQKQPAEYVMRQVENMSLKRIAKIEQRHLRWWQGFWEKSYVQIPDKTIEKQYYLSLYGMASCSRDKDFPPSIFGSWITMERPAWNGDYHLNYNHIAPFYGLYSSNRIEQAEPYYYPLLEQIERGGWYAEKIANIEDGIMLPVGIGPLGIETVRQNELMEKYSGYVESGNAEHGGLFFGQKSNAAYCTTNLATQFYTTYDKDFALRVWPFVYRVANFWEHYLTYENGRYVIYNDAIHEGTIGTMNPILSLGLVRMVLKLACDMSAYLNIMPDRRDKWTEITEHLAAYPTQEKDGKKVFRYTEKGVAWWNDNTLGIQHIYPAGTIGWNSDPELLRVAYNTIDVMQRWIDFNGSNSFFPAAVRVGYNPDIIYQKLHEYSEHTYRNGFQLNNPHGIENFSTVPNTVNEMLCSAYGDVLRLFSCWPMQEDASFSNIRVYGAFLVSSSLENGKVRFVQLTSEKGRECTLLNPWKGKQVQVSGSKSGTKTYSGEYITFPTGENETFVITEAD